MTIRRRLTLWYAVVLAASLVLVLAASYGELLEQFKAHRNRSEKEDPPLEETAEILFKVGLPAMILGILGGGWLTTRALKPLAELTQAAQGIDERTLGTPLPRSGNGDELDQLARVLNGMQTRLNDAFAQIREFTLHASHELKTPLTVMHGELEAAMQRPDLPPEERERQLSQLDELRRLSRIVDGLTLLTRADSGQLALPIEPLSLDDIVRDIHADTLILAESSGVKVELGPCDPVRVRGNAHRLRQMLLNLADNSVKYNVSGGRISMSLRRGEGWAEFVISNTGPGIAPVALPRVFDRFYRGDAAHGSAVEGSGLGLSIVRWIASAHGGTVRIESQLGALTTVTARFPLLAE